MAPSVFANHRPPALANVAETLRGIPREVRPWIARHHLQYLDDRIHRIGPLTAYLESCDPVSRERNEFIAFVDNSARSECLDLDSYLADYASRFHTVRARVDAICDVVMNHDQSWASPERVLPFWRDFTYINEVDSLHGMFLTSGRWYVNVMLPPVRELAFCTLPPTISANKRVEAAYHVARRVITPRFASVPSWYEVSWEKRFGSLLVPLLQYFDRRLLFLFEALASVPEVAATSLNTFVDDVANNPDRYADLFQLGVYPPFAWHELQASRRARRPAREYSDATERLLSTTLPEFTSRMDAALAAVSVLKEYELNYNNYNYKGRFGLVSKYQYHVLAQQMRSDARDAFLDKILLDRFYDALAIVEDTVQGRPS